MARFNTFVASLVFLLSMAFATPALSADYSFRNPPPGCTVSGDTMTCPNGLILQWDDTLSVTGNNQTLNITGNSTLSNARINSAGNESRLTINANGNVTTGAFAHINAVLNISGVLELGSANTVNGDVTATIIRVRASSSVINGALSSSTSVHIGSGATINGPISGTDITTTSPVTVNGNITATGNFTLASGSSVTGDINAVQVVLNPSDSDVHGNVVATDYIEIGSGSGITGNAQAGNTILLRPANAFITESATAPTISNNYGTIGGRTICNRSTGATPVNCQDEAPPPAQQSLLPMCTDIWYEAERTANQWFPTPNFPLPSQATDRSLPQTLPAGDYLQRGNVTLSNNISTPEASARVYVDGDLTIARGTDINASGNPEHFILIVTGTLTIERDVRINGYIYAANNVVFTDRWAIWQANARVTGGIVTNGYISTGLLFRPVINYHPPSRAIQGGNFCVGQPQQELWLQFSDSDWSSSFGSVNDSSPLPGIVINRDNGFSLPDAPLSVRAPTPPQFSNAGADSALVADANHDFLGTCSFAEFTASEAQYFEASDTPRLDFKGSFTVGAWVYPTSRPNELMTVVSKDENYEFHLRSDGRINWWWQDARGAAQEFNSNFQVPLHEWSYIGIRYTPTRQTIFKWDGTHLALAENTSQSGLRTNDAPVQIGADQNVQGRYFNGRIDEVRIVRGALTDSELRELGRERASACGLQLQCMSDNFENVDEFPLLWLAARSSGNFTPQVNNNRLRINQAVGDQATVAALRRAFPAANNYIQVSFDFYAYAGSRYDNSIGGDGIAVVFSDAETVPIPGSYGGSLGYAQRHGSGVDGPGFAGGWLGVGLDIFGNFSQRTEGRIGGYTTGAPRTRNRVALRGAESTGYEFIEMSEPLTNMSSSSPTRPNQPDSYRISIDSRDPNRPSVTVERRAPGSTRFITILSTSLDGQPPMPELLRLSFTGSTGSAFSIHEIDNLEVCALQSQGLGTVLDHVRLSHSGSLVSCFSDTLELLGCLNSDCSQPYRGNGQVTLQASAGQWRNVPHGGQNAQIPLVNGHGQADLSLLEGGTANLTLLQTNPIAVGAQPLRCYQGPLGPDNQTQVPCSILYRLAGIQFVEPENPNTLDRRPVVAGITSERALRIVETNVNAESLASACQARVSSEAVTTRFDMECLNPGQCNADQQARVGPAEASPSVSILTNAATNLAFDQDGMARFNFNYSDVGQVRLNAQVQLEETPSSPAVTLKGSSAPFVSTPHSLQLHALNENGEIRTSSDAYRAAGEPFAMVVQALNAQGQPTPNFGREVPEITVEANFEHTLYPAGGEAGELNLNRFRAFSEIPGAFISEDATWSEVGTFAMRANLQEHNYLGVATEGTLERPMAQVGRFYPSHFVIEGSSVLDACSGFTYMGQPEVGIDFTLHAVSVGNQRTLNYGYADYEGTAAVRVTAANTSPADVADDNFALRLAIPETNEDGSLIAPWDRGEMNFSTDAASFAKRADRVPDGPYSALALGLQIAGERDQRGFQADSLNLDTHSGGSARLEGELDLRYGRLIVSNTSGPESQPLPVDIRAEFWDGNRFVVHQNDSCTELFAGQLHLVDNPLGLATTPDSGSGTVSLVGGMTSPQSLWWRAPTVDPLIGEFEFEYRAPPWLQYPFAYDGADDNQDMSPRAFGAFGQYRGNDRVLYWLELR